MKFRSAPKGELVPTMLQKAGRAHQGQSLADESVDFESSWDDLLKDNSEILPHPGGHCDLAKPGNRPSSSYTKSSVHIDCGVDDRTGAGC